MKIFRILLCLIALLCVSSSAYANATPLSSYQEGDAMNLTGTVSSASGEEFTINLGRGSVTVNVGDWEWFTDEAEKVKVGEKVTVTGIVDDGFFTGRKLQARTIYVHDRDSYYRPMDIEDYAYQTWLDTPPPEGSAVSLTGIVKKVENGGLLLNTGKTEIQVVMDKIKAPKVNTGDRIRVSGVLNDDFFEARKMEATRIIVIHEKSRKK